MSLLDCLEKDIKYWTTDTRKGSCNTVIYCHYETSRKPIHIEIRGNTFSEQIIDFRNLFDHITFIVFKKIGVSDYETQDQNDRVVFHLKNSKIYEISYYGIKPGSSPVGFVQVKNDGFVFPGAPNTKKIETFMDIQSFYSRSNIMCCSFDLRRKPKIIKYFDELPEFEAIVYYINNTAPKDKEIVIEI